jgi:hypothetical protein
VKVEVNPRSNYSAQGIKPGDFVAVHFTGDVDHGFMGTVVRAGAERLRLIVHQPVGAKFLDECLNWDCEFPWTSVAFVRHVKRLPGGCKCRDQG